MCTSLRASLATLLAILGSSPALASADGILAADGSDANLATVESGEGVSGWEFSTGPYLWMAGLKGDLGLVEEVEPVAVDLSFIDIMGHLKFTLMGTFEARHGRFVASADMLYLKMGASDEIEIREVDFLEADLTSATFVTTLTAGYRAIDSGQTSVDLLAGGRINSMKTSLDLDGPQKSFSGSKRKTWVDPILGVRVRTALGTNWSLEGYADVGGFGVASDLTWQLSGVVKYDLSRRWSLTGGWRHLDTDFEDNGFVFDAAMDGPIIGALYRF